MANSRRDIQPTTSNTMKKIIFTLMFAVSVVGAFNVIPTRAADHEPVARVCSYSFIGLPTWYAYLELDDDCQVVGPKKSGAENLDVPKVITRVALAIIDILMRIGGMVAFGFIVYSGFRFVMSQGNPDQEKAARETAINALIGMVITIFAIAIVTYIGRRLTTT